MPIVGILLAGISTMRDVLLEGDALSLAVVHPWLMQAFSWMPQKSPGLVQSISPGTNRRQPCSGGQGPGGPGREQQNWAEGKELSLNVTSKLRASPVRQLSALSHTFVILLALCPQVTQWHRGRAHLG